MKKICLTIIAVLAVIDLALIGTYIVKTRGSVQKSIHDERTTFEQVTLPDGVVADMGTQTAGDPLQETRTADGSSGVLTDLQNILSGNVSAGRYYGIDVSRYQGEIDWESVAEAGIDFAMIRVGYRTTDTGLIMEDPYAIENLEGADNAGLKVGVYFSSTAVSEEEALEEAAWVLEEIKGYPITYPVAYDCEGFDAEGSRMADLSNEERTACALAFMKAVYNQGYDAMIYGSRSDLEDAYVMSEVDEHFYVWCAQYNDSEYTASDKCSYKGTLDMWQYTSQGSVAGIGSTVDLDVAYFTYKKTAEAKDPSARGNITVTQDTEDSVYETVSESVTPKIRVNLRLAPTTRVSENIYATVDRGTILQRVGTGTNGWSRISYDGKTLYCVSSYLMDAADLSDPSTVQTEAAQGEANTVTEYGVVFDLCNMQVTPKIKTNLRSVPSSDSDATVVATLLNGEYVTCTGLGRNGWSRVTYNGQTLYCVTNYMTEGTSGETAASTAASENSGTAETTAAAESAASSGAAAAGDTAAVAQIEIGMNFTDCNKQVTPKSEVNLRTEPSTEHEGTVFTKISAGEVVTCTAESDNGWSRIIYNGYTLYAVTSYLTEAPGSTVQ